jgi:hypothetical protein
LPQAHCRKLNRRRINERYLGDESALRRHSNVASVLHLGQTGSNYFYAMEFVEGETLDLGDVFYGNQPTPDRPSCTSAERSLRLLWREI